MVRCERFIVKHSIKDRPIIDDRIMSFLTHPVIYDRVEERKIMERTT